MEEIKAKQLMPVHIDLEQFVNALLANTDITDIIGSRITLNPPVKAVERPYLYFTVSEPTQKKTDDMSAIWFRHFMDWRLVAPASFTLKDMRNFMEIIMLELQQFQGSVLTAKTAGNTTTAQLYMVDWRFSAHFPDENRKGYQSMIYTVDMEWN